MSGTCRQVVTGTHAAFISAGEAQWPVVGQIHKIDVCIDHTHAQTRQSGAVEISAVKSS